MDGQFGYYSYYYPFFSFSLPSLIPSCRATMTSTVVPPPHPSRDFVTSNPLSLCRYPPSIQSVPVRCRICVVRCSSRSDALSLHLSRACGRQKKHLKSRKNKTRKDKNDASLWTLGGPPITSVVTSSPRPKSVRWNKMAFASHHTVPVGLTETFI